MVHWGWLIAAFLIGAICGVATFIGIACCVVAGIAEEEEQEMYERYMNESR